MTVSIAFAVAVAVAVAVGIVGIVGRSRPPNASFDAHDAATPAIEPTRPLDALFGTQPASFGSVFANVELGRIVDRLPDVPFHPDVKISLWTTGRRVDGVDIKVPFDPGSAGCYQFAGALHRRWGPSSEADDANSETWEDVAHNRVATFTQDFNDCNVRFVRRVSPEQWLNATRSSLVPIWAIGHPVAELEAALGLGLPPTGDDPTALRWRDESLGDRFRDIELTAHLKRGRVVAITVTPPFDDPVVDVLWHRVKTLYGAPDLIEGHEETIELRWRRGISVGKYWGQDAFNPHVGRAARRPRRPDADGGVLISIRFGT